MQLSEKYFEDFSVTLLNDFSRKGGIYPFMAEWIFIYFLGGGGLGRWTGLNLFSCSYNCSGDPLHTSRYRQHRPRHSCFT